MSDDSDDGKRKTGIFLRKQKNKKKQVKSKQQQYKQKRWVKRKAKKTSS